MVYYEHEGERQSPPPRPTFVLVELKTPFQPSYDADVVRLEMNAWLPPGADRARFQVAIESAFRRLLDEGLRDAVGRMR